MGSFLIAFWVQVSCGAFAWLSLRVQLQALEQLHYSMMAPQQQGPCLWYCCHLALLFLCCPVGQGARVEAVSSCFCCLCK